MIQIAANKAKCIQFMNVRRLCLLTQRHISHRTALGKEEMEEGPSECDYQYHSNDKPVVALSTGWFNHKSRCFKNITISAIGQSVVAMVVDECDSTRGCDSDRDYQPPCDNIVDASKAVCEGLGIPKSQWGWYDITWSEA